MSHHEMDVKKIAEDLIKALQDRQSHDKLRAEGVILLYQALQAESEKILHGSREGNDKHSKSERISEAEE